MTSSPSHEIFNRIEALTNLIYLIKVDARQAQKFKGEFGNSIRRERLARRLPPFQVPIIGSTR